MTSQGCFDLNYVLYHLFQQWPSYYYLHCVVYHTNPDGILESFNNPNAISNSVLNEYLSSLPIPIPIIVLHLNSSPAISISDKSNMKKFHNRVTDGGDFYEGRATSCLDRGNKVQSDAQIKSVPHKHECGLNLELNVNFRRKPYVQFKEVQHIISSEIPSVGNRISPGSVLYKLKSILMAQFANWVLRGIQNLGEIRRKGFALGSGKRIE
ncbi:hypothetical protein H5410_009944 [Solanum commersonii]|uniref:Uncharacterized protein n=1 Tax=Solanum commersonii TaxID=4109 RepID=A0A9J6AJC5_SOLCO|nr:hypothetical protein H5410_009944 [Solanum commersonii]